MARRRITFAAVVSTSISVLVPLAAGSALAASPAGTASGTTGPTPGGVAGSDSVAGTQPAGMNRVGTPVHSSGSTAEPTVVTAVGAPASAATAGRAVMKPNAPTPGQSWYVNSDTTTTGGTGTARAPFTSLQAAVDNAAAGDTIFVTGGAVHGYAESVTITKSLTIVGQPAARGENAVGHRYRVTGDSTNGFALTVSGAGNVSVSNLGFASGKAGTPAVQVLGGSGVTLDGVSVLAANAGAAGSIAVDGHSNGVTVSRSIIDGGATAADAGIGVASGAQNVTIASNVFPSGAGFGVQATDAQNLFVVGNTIQRGCAGGISVAGTSTATYIENNVLVDADPAVSAAVAKGGAACGPTWGADIVTSAGSASAVADFNTFVSPSGSGTARYRWNDGGTTYAGAADTGETALPAAVTLGPDANAVINAGLAWNSTAVHSASASAPGAISSDLYGNAPYTDRGAIVFVDTAAPTLAVSMAGMVATPTVTMSGNVPAKTYAVDWGDSPTPPVPTSTPPAPHTYTTAGSHPVTLTVVDQLGNTSTASTTVTADQITAGMTLTPVGALSTSFADASTSSSAITNYSVNWGDGSQPQSSATPPTTHTFPHAGTFDVTLTVTDAAGQSASTTPTAVTTQGSDYTAVGPIRIMDTRDGTGLGGQKPKVTAANPVSLKVAGVNGVPNDVTAVAINVTVANTESGFGALGVTPDGAKLTTSNLNYAPGQIVPNLVIVPVAADGSIEFQKLGPGQTDVIADLAGYYTPTAAQGFGSVTPYRALDTRTGAGWGGGRIATGKPIRLKVTGAGGVPASGVTAVAVNLTVTDTSGFGNIAAGPAGFTAGKTSWTSNLNYGNAQTIANMAIVPVDANGYIDLVNAGPGSASLILDVNGYYSDSAQSAFLTGDPERLVDSRDVTNNQIKPQYVRSFGWGQNNGVVNTDLVALVTNTTVVNTSAGGFLTVFPYNTPPGGHPTPPNASNLNWGPNQIVPNLTMAVPGPNGYFSYYNGTPNVYPAGVGGIDLIVDLFGFYSKF